MLKNLSIKQKRIFAVVAIATAAAVVLCLLFLNGGLDLLSQKPTLSVISGDVEAADQNEFAVNMELSHLPEYLYPAASISVQFDADKLEFVGVTPGTIKPYDNYVPGGGEEEAGEPSLKSAEWLYNSEVCNQTGQINAMYIDMTGERNAFGKDSFTNAENKTLVSLNFRLKPGVSAGEALALEIVDAVFAAENGDEMGTSVSVTGDTLKLKNGEIKVL